MLIDGEECQVISEYENTITVKNGRFTGLYHKKNKKLVSGWLDGNHVIYAHKSLSKK